MLDIDGFLTSPQFLSQFASFITAILTLFVEQFIAVFFGTTG